MWHTDDEEGDGESGSEEGGCEAGPGVEDWRHLSAMDVDVVLGDGVMWEGLWTLSGVSLEVR